MKWRIPEQLNKYGTPFEHCQKREQFLSGMYTEWGPSTGGQPAENKYTNFVVQHLKFILKVTGHCVKDNFEVEGESIPQNSLSQIRQKGDRYFFINL